GLPTDIAKCDKQQTGVKTSRRIFAGQLYLRSGGNPEPSRPDRPFFNMTFADESTECIDIRTQPERKVFHCLIGYSRFDIQQWKSPECRRHLERPIIRPASERADRRSQTNSGTTVFHRR